MLFRVLAGAALASIVGVCPIAAQTIRDVTGPKEIPPASYTAKQYVDSRGCVFVRAGYGGQVTWVPRVDRSRKVLCGYQPSIAVAKAAPAAPVVAPTAEAPKVIVAETGTPAPARVEITVPQPVVKAAAPVNTAPVKQVRRAQPAQIAQPAQANGGVRIIRASSCPNLSMQGRVYRLSDGREALRCSSAGTEAYVIVSRQAALQAAPSALPKGYKSAWKDGRLNPHRAKGTAAGEAAMHRKWTRTVPMEMIPAGAEVATRSATLTVTSKSPRVSSKTTATATATATATGASGQGGYYIRAGVFGVAANATGAAQKLNASGLPVRMGRMTSKGKALQVVLVGPFTGKGAASQALGRVRGAGFADAFIQK